MMPALVDVGCSEVFAENSDNMLRKKCRHQLVFAMAKGLEKDEGLGRAMGSFIFNLF